MSQKRIQPSQVDLALSDLSDVSASPSDGDVLTFDNDTSIWIAAEPTGGDGDGTWGSITGTLSDQTDLQSALDEKVSTDQDFFITGDGTAGTTNSTPGIGIGVEVGGNNNAHMEINSPTDGVSYLDFTTVDEDYKMPVGWYDTDGQFRLDSSEGEVAVFTPEGDLTPNGDISAASLSGENHGDQDLERPAIGGARPQSRRDFRYVATRLKPVVAHHTTSPPLHSARLLPVALNRRFLTQPLRGCRRLLLAQIPIWAAPLATRY